MKKTGGISHLYYNQILRAVAFSVFNVFVPVYLLTLDYSLNSVIGYFLLLHVISFVFVPISLVVSKRFGLKSTMVLGMPFAILFLVSLQFMQVFSIPIYLIAFLNAIQNSFYFIPLHSYFARLSESGRRGSQFSNFESIGKFVGLIAPIAGAYVATFFGFTTLFYLSIVLVGLSYYPLLKLKNMKPQTRVSFRGSRRLSKRNKDVLIWEVADTIRVETEALVWPLFIFIVLEEFISVGYVAFFVGLGVVVFTLFVGRHYDKKSKLLMLKLGGLLYACIWVARVFIDSQVPIYLVSIIAGFLAIMIKIPFGAIFYDRAETERDVDELIVVREIPTVIGRCILWGAMLLVADKFTVAFALAALASIFFAFFRFDSRK